MPPSNPGPEKPLGPIRAVEVSPGNYRRIEYYRPGAPTLTALGWGVVIGLVLGWVLIHLGGRP